MSVELDWSFNRMDSERNITDVFNNNPQGRRLKKTTKYRWWKCVQTDFNKCKIKNWEEKYKKKPRRLGELQ